MTMRNFEIAARVLSGQLSSAGYEKRRLADEKAQPHSVRRPEITDEDLARMRAELPALIAGLR
jgi:hypothetical protein